MTVFLCFLRNKKTDRQKDRQLNRKTNRQTDKETEASIKSLYQGQTDIKTKLLKTDRRTAKQKRESQNVTSMHLNNKKTQITKIIRSGGERGNVPKLFSGHV